ncbi:hypothetical protein, partial [Halomonas sp. KM-1]|uniref:hypothetical protein n=1 Tax=Halomonas sp. KM-1 TaxID=590061 RepID=UPI001EE66046
SARWVGLVHFSYLPFLAIETYLRLPTRFLKQTTRKDSNARKSFSYSWQRKELTHGLIRAQYFSKQGQDRPTSLFSLHVYHDLYTCGTYAIGHSGGGFIE